MTHRGDSVIAWHRVLTSVAVTLCCTAVPLTSFASAAEYCDWETFNVSCQADEVIAVGRARYGRMTLGRCVTTNYGSIGCGADVTPYLDSECSGRRACALNVITLSQLPLQTDKPCPPDFKYYLEATYECLKVYSNVNGSTPCPAGSASLTPVILDGLSEGLLASAVTLETGMGGPACPWIIRVAPHQRINITLLDFSVVSSPFHAGGGGGGGNAPAARRGQQYRPSSGRGTAAGGWDGPMSMPSWLGAPCDEYAVVLEGGDGSDGRRTTSGRNATVCGRRRRQSPVYLSDTNVIQVRVDAAASRSHRFILKYQAFGCPPPVAPAGAWVTHSAHHALIQCNATDSDELPVRWQLTCRGTSWHGHVGNCTGLASRLAAAAHERTENSWLLAEMFQDQSGFPYGILFVIALGVVIGVIAGVLMLLAVLAYLRQRRQRKIRSRSHYVLHDAELTGSTQTFDGRDNKQTGSGIYAGRRATTPIYKPSSGGTWQRTRPLPVPRPEVDDEDSGGRALDDDDIIAMTPLTSACSEHLLATSGADDGVLNVVGPASCCTAASGANDADRLDTAAGIHCRTACDQRGCCQRDVGGPGPVAHGRTRSTPQPIDATRLLLLGGDGAPHLAAVPGGGGGYERCVADRARGGRPSGGGPYYFKLDLTSGLSADHPAPSKAGERPASPPCLMCVQQQQQQQQQHATLPRRITSSPQPQRGPRY